MVKRSMSPTKRAAILAKTNGHCAKCGVGLVRRWIADHINPVWLSEDDRIENMQALCVPCDKLKTFGRGGDISRIAKTKRQAKMITRRPRGKLHGPGWDKRFRKRMNGKVERR